MNVLELWKQEDYDVICVQSLAKLMNKVGEFRKIFLTSKSIVKDFA